MLCEIKALFVPPRSGIQFVRFLWEMLKVFMIQQQSVVGQHLLSPLFSVGVFIMFSQYAIELPTLF